MTTNQATGKIKASRVNNLAADTYIGPEGQIWYDVTTGVLRLGDNVTPGGTIIGGGNGTPGGANTEIQFNNNGVFGGNIALTFDVANSVLNLTGLANVTGNVTATDTITAGNEVSANLVTAENALFLNANVVTANYTIPDGYNAISSGPITIPDGIIVNSENSNWGII